MAIPHVLNYGMGIESTAILLRWILEPKSRNFALAGLTQLEEERAKERLSRSALPPEQC